MDGKEAIAQFKDWYMESYGVKPTEKLIATFCKMKGIEIEREEVTNVEEQVEYKVCSVLDDVPVVTNVTEGAINQYTEENYKALETNYHNLLAEHQEISAIALELKQVNEKFESKLDILANYLVVTMKMIKKYRRHLPDEFLKELGEIEKYAEDLKNGNDTSTESTKQPQN